jgi:predicted permease
MKPQPENYSEERKLTLTTELLRRVSTLPGVQAAAFAENGPLGSRIDGDMVEGPSHEGLRVGADRTSPGFFDTVGIPRIAGRDFTAADRSGAPMVVIINQTLARKLFPNQNALGRMLHIPHGKWDGDYQIVGIVADTHYYDVHKPPQPFLWASIAQIPPYMPTLHVRTKSAATAAMTAAVLREFDAVDKGFPVFNIRTMASRIEDSLSRERMVASLAGAFGLLALTLAAVGLYGLLAYSVSRRTREIGIRMALGANGRSVMWMVASEAFTLIACGSAAGIVLAIAGSWALARFVQGVAPVDPAMSAMCAGVMCVIAAAVVAPALRGSRIDPVRALHE